MQVRHCSWGPTIVTIGGFPVFFNEKSALSRSTGNLLKTNDLHGVDRPPISMHLEVKVRRRRLAGRSHKRDFLSRRYVLANVDQIGRGMGVAS